MKVGLYNRWLATLGGGEKHGLAIAEFLSQKHDVHVITHSPVSREEAAHRFNLDLSEVKFDVIPNRSVEELSPLTGMYDLFINSSFMDFIRSHADHSASLVFFPAPLSAATNAPFKYRLGWALKRWFMVPTIAEGFRQFSRLPTRPNAVETTSRIQVQCPASPQPYVIRFQIAGLHSDVRDLSIRMDGRLLQNIVIEKMGEFYPVTLEIPGAGQMIHNLVIEADCSQASLGMDASLCLDSLAIDTPRYQAFSKLSGYLPKRIGIRFQLLPFQKSDILQCVDSYNALWTNSEYTRRWIKNYWGRNSSVLYPPIDVRQFTPGIKKRQILSVGRFFAGDHNKKHGVMIKAFREMVDGGLTGWELHLVGGSTPGAVHQNYLADVIAGAGGYPIHVHPDYPYPNLLQLYNESAIYWHASGFGEDEARDPIKFEHFGITTVEAMAAGCVPVVIGKGGQPEIVQHGKDGYIWNNLEELKLYTHKLIGQAELYRQLSARAVEDSRRYSIENFHINLAHLLDDIGIV